VKKLYATIIFALIFSFGQFAYAEPNTGFIDSSIWYSETPKVEGDSVDIHTAIWNGNDSEITVHVEFYDGTVLLGGRDINIAKDTLVDVHIPWKVTAGTHSISAKITKSSTVISGATKSISVTSNQTEISRITILTKSAVESGATEPIDTIAKKMADSLPAQVAVPATNVVTKIDSFRENTSLQIDTSIKNVKDRITEMNASTKAKTTTDKTLTEKDTKDKKDTQATKSNSLSGTDKPIAYVELFFLTLASFVFKQKVLFYGLGIVILFLVLRFIYRHAFRH
jgi:hypothetical protein